jgi:hypothetical protein
MHEADNLTRIFAEEAKARQGTRTDLVATLPQGSEGDHKTRTKVAEAVGMKRSTYAKVKQVHDTAHDTAATWRTGWCFACGKFATSKFVAAAGESPRQSSRTSRREDRHLRQDGGSGRPKANDSPRANSREGYDDG